MLHRNVVALAHLASFINILDKSYVHKEYSWVAYYTNYTLQSKYHIIAFSITINSNLIHLKNSISTMISLALRFYVGLNLINLFRC